MKRALRRFSTNWNDFRRTKRDHLPRPKPKRSQSTVIVRQIRVKSPPEMSTVSADNRINDWRRPRCRPVRRERLSEVKTQWRNYGEYGKRRKLLERPQDWAKATARIATRPVA